MEFLCNLNDRAVATIEATYRYIPKSELSKNSQSTSGFVQKRTRLVLSNTNDLANNN